MDTQPPDLDPSVTIIAHEYRTAHSGGTYFLNDMTTIFGNNEGVAYFKILAPNDGPKPVCCLFPEVNFSGGVFCAGEGGGAVPEAWRDRAMSVS